ncbi:MAG: type II toxin-antitoxin system VapC family toxin [Verrucomicrobia bacterium]|nr:type II toxin-antitoxin system VapC family toxin [Verrucomicrobiota bacterium]
MIFVDTGALLGRYLIGDQYHQAALDLWEKVRRRGEHCITSNFILDETATLLARRSSYRFAAAKARIIYSSELFQIFRPGMVEELEALELFEKYADQEVSFTDCISFVLMRKENVHRAFTFDAHFERVGFRLWA